MIGAGTPGNRTWSVQSLPDGGSEATTAQTPDGNLYRNDRPAITGAWRGARGRSLGPFADDEGLPDRIIRWGLEGVSRGVVWLGH